MSDLNTALLGKLIIRAGHPGTSDVEALGSIRKAYQMIDESKKSIDDILNGKAAPKPPSALSLYQRIETLEERLNEQQATIRSLTREKSALTKQIGDLKTDLKLERKRRAAHEPKYKPNEDGTYRFADFSKEAESKFGANWDAFVSAETGVPVKKIRSWRKHGVPVSVMEMVLSAQPKKQLSGTLELDEMIRMEQLQIDNPRISAATIAKTLSTEFGREIGADVVKAAIERSKKIREQA